MIAAAPPVMEIVSIFLVAARIVVGMFNCLRAGRAVLIRPGVGAG